MDEKLTTAQERQIMELLQKYLKSNAFTTKKITDTPTDALDVVPRKYANMNGTVANRPPSSVATVGQKYFATDTKIPMVYDTTGWVNGVGSIVALNN